MPTAEREAAELLWRNRSAGTTLSGLPKMLRPKDADVGHAIQAEWPTVTGQAHINVRGPLPGRILTPCVFAVGDVISLAGNPCGWSSLVNPETYFDDVNISIHGIEPHMIVGPPTLPAVAEIVRALMLDTVSVCHSHFDRIALQRAFDRYSLQPVAATWLDSARVVRRTWKDLAWSRYGLKNVCNKIGYQLNLETAVGRIQGCCDWRASQGETTQWATAHKAK